MRLLGVTVSVGLAVSLAVYYDALFSVWCFFAAAGSTVIMLHVIAEARAGSRAVRSA